MDTPTLAELTDADYEVARKAVEDVLVEFRDRRISMFTRNNGLVIRERDGTDSSIVRLSVEEALRVSVTAILAARGSV